MDKKKLWFLNSGGTSYTSEYNAILTYATAQGFTLPSLAQRVAQNNFIVALKAAGIWTKLDIFYNFLTDGNSGFAKINWKSPGTYQADGTGHDPTFTANIGFKGNGSSQYLNTQWTPSSNGVNFTLADASFGAVSDNNDATNAVLLGCNNGANYIYIQRATGANGAVNLDVTLALTTSVVAGQSLMHASKASNTVKLFSNGVSVSSGAKTSDALVNFPMFIGAFNGSGTASLFSSANIQMAFAGASLTGLESAFYTAWINYKTTGLLNSLISYWSFDANANDTRAINNGTFQGGASSGAGGIINNGLILSGTNQYVSIADHPWLSFNDGTTELPFSYSFWIKPTNFSQAGYLISKDLVGQAEYYINSTASTGLINFTLYSALNASVYIVVQSVTGLTAGSWNHVVVTYNGNKSLSGMKIYLNGSLCSVTTGSGGSYANMSNGTSPLFLGASNNSPTTTESIGTMDEIFLISKELSQAEITQLYNGGAGLAYTSFT